MAVPMILAEIVNVLYSIVDRMYIGHIPEVGKYALTGLGIAAPLITTVAAFGSLCGTGGAPLCSIARGRRDYDEAQNIMGNAFMMLIILGAALSFFTLAFMKPILYFFGAGDQTYPYARDYAMIYMAGTLFSMISFGMNFFINAQGFARIGMLTITIGAVANIILDPIFIFVFHLGIKGAAIATVIAQFVSALWVLLFLTGKRASIRLSFPSMRLHRRIVINILGLGASGFVMKSTTGLVQILYNIQLKRYGGDLYVGSMTVVNSLREVLIMTFHGINSGSQPVIGFNYGAEKYDRVKKGISFATRFALIYAVIVLVLVMAFSKQIASVFTNDADLIELCTRTIRIFFCFFVFKAFQMTGQNVYIALGKGKLAVFFSMLRKIIVVTPLVFLLPLIPGLGADGVFWADAIADVLCSSVTFLFMYFTIYRKLSSQNDPSLLRGD